MLNRRHLFAASAVVVTAAALPAVAMAQSGHDWFIAEARELIVMTDQVNAGADETFCKRWDDRLGAFLRKAEALPLTPENAAIKALAISVLHYEDMDEWESDSAADQRLAGQLVRCLIPVT